MKNLLVKAPSGPRHVPLSLRTMSHLCNKLGRTLGE